MAGWFSRPQGYQPTARDNWNIQREAQREARRDRKADAREAARLQEQMFKEELKADADARKAAQAAKDAADKEAAAEEKAILTRAVLKRVDGTEGNPKGIPVWHHRAEPPQSVDVKRRRKGLGVILALPNPKLEQMSSRHTVLWAMQERKPHVIDAHPEWVEASKTGIADAKKHYWQLLMAIRDDKQMGYLFHAAGITTDNKRKEMLSGTYGAYERDVTERSVPTLTDVVIHAGGLELKYAPRLGDNAKRWRSGIDSLRNGFRGFGIDASKVEIVDDNDGSIRLMFNDRDPFAEFSMQTGTWDDEKFRSLLGIDSRGREVWIGWREVSGMVVGGVSGSGKTASMLPIFRQFEGNAELFVFDGKAQRDLHPLRHISRVYDNSGDISAPLETVQMLEKLRVLRGDALYEKLGASNFWHLSSAQRRELGMKPIFVILDEAQVWFKASSDKDKAKIQNAIRESVENLIRMGRSSGIVVIITTQRPSAESIPTDVRDNAQLRLSFRVTNDIMTQMVLGSVPKGILDPTAIGISDKGRFIMDTEGIGMVLGQAGYIGPDELESQLAHAEPVPDQWDVAERFAGSSRVGSRPGTPSPARASAPTAQPPATEMTQAEKDAEIRRIAIENGWLKEDAEEAPNAEQAEMQAGTEPSNPETPSPAKQDKPKTEPKTTGFDL